MSATDERRDMKRKLTTIFCADVSGYSRMMGADEARTLATLKEYREAIEGFIARHHGRVVSWSGDGLLAEFASVVEAVQCAAEVQRELKARNASRDEHLRMTFRIGINLGDVMADGDDIFGEGVNIAARLQQMASPGGILVSSPVYDQVRGKLSMGFAALGNQSVKNIAGEVAVYAVTLEGVAPHTAPPPQPQRWRDDPEDSPIQTTPKRAKLFRRGLAVLVDYMIVLCAVLAGALALNSTINPTIVRMDLDVPFIDYGDMIDRTPWRTVSASQEDNLLVTKSERVVTYEYMGLFTQTYNQTRSRGTVLIGKGEKGGKNGSHPTPSPSPSAAPAPSAAPQPPAQPVPPEPVPPPPEPNVPVPPPPPPPVPNEHGILEYPGGPDGTKTFTAGGVTVEVGPDGVRTSDGVVIDGKGNLVSGPDVDVDMDGSGFSFSWDDGDENGKGSSFRFSHISEQLLDSATGKPITRPSLDMLSLIFLLLYFTVMEMGRRGTTIGKNAFDMMVTREDGRPLGFGNALARNAIKILTSFILPVAVLVVLFSRRRQGIHDRLMGTVVVEDPNR